MTRSAFRKAAILWSLCLVGVVLVGPVTMALLALSGQCSQTQGICLFGPLFAIFWGGPIGATAFSLLLLWTIGRRVKTLEMSAGWTAASFVWLCSAAPMIAFGSFGVFEGVSGLAQGKVAGLARLFMVSWFLGILFLLTLIAFLGRAETGSMRTLSPPQRQAYLVAALAAAYVTVLLLGHAFSALGRIPFFGIDALLRPVSALAWKIHGVATLGTPYWMTPLFYWIDFAVFASALAYLISNQDEDDNVAAGPEISPRPVARRASFGKRGG